MKTFIAQGVLTIAYKMTAHTLSKAIVRHVFSFVFECQAVQKSLRTVYKQAVSTRKRTQEKHILTIWSSLQFLDFDDTQPRQCQAFENQQAEGTYQNLRCFNE